MRHRVLATDAQERAVLATIRSLASQGIDVTAVGSSRTAPGLWSRAPRRRRLARDPQLSVEGFIADLEQIVRQEAHDVILAGTDMSVAAISRHRDRLAPYVALGLPSAEVVDRVLNKSQMADAARAVGLDPPEACVCNDVWAALQTAESFGYPVLVKPVHVVDEPGGDGIHRTRAELIGDSRSLQALSLQLGTCIVQRRVAGHVLSVGGVASGDGLLAVVVSRYDRTWPTDAGSACFSRTITPPPELVERVAALVADLGWEGIFELELVEGADGRLAAIDFNPRAFGSLALAVGAGVQLPAIWCDWLLGMPQSPSRPRTGVGYRWEDADVRHMVWQVRHHHVRDALAIAKPRRNVFNAYFRAGDPLPSLARGVELFGRARVKVRTSS
jgi:predicted ATP-grasp superfamily ATP-dependent carboligase